MWIGILSRHGYHIERLSSRVREVLLAAGIDYPETPVKK
jgi:hypothetical protein